MNLRDIQHVGFIGLGAMGKPIAVNLIQKLPENTTVHLFDVVEAPVDELCAQYPTKVVKEASAKQVAEASEIIFTIVPEGCHVREVYLNPETGIGAADISGKILLDCSTIDTTTSLAVKDHINKTFPSASFYDTPISGGTLGARAATLGVYIGCSESDPNFPFLKELLLLIGKNIIPCGGPSLGLVVKLSNNYLSGVIALATCEAMNMAMRAGVNPHVAAHAFSVGSGKNVVADKSNPVPGICPDAPASHGYRGGFKVQLMSKDMVLATEMAKSVGAKTVLSESAVATYDAASQDPNCADLDSKIVYRYIGGIEDWEEIFGAAKGR